MGPSMLSQRPLACRPPKRPGFTNNGCISSSPTASAGGTHRPWPHHLDGTISTNDLLGDQRHTNCIRLSRVQPALCSRLTECPAAAPRAASISCFPRLRRGTTAAAPRAATFDQFQVLFHAGHVDSDEQATLASSRNSGSSCLSFSDWSLHFA